MNCMCGRKCVQLKCKECQIHFFQWHKIWSYKYSMYVYRGNVLPCSCCKTWYSTEHAPCIWFQVQLHLYYMACGSFVHTLYTLLILMNSTLSLCRSEYELLQLINKSINQSRYGYKSPMLEVMHVWIQTAIMIICSLRTNSYFKLSIHLLRGLPLMIFPSISPLKNFPCNPVLLHSPQSI